MYSLQLINLGRMTKRCKLSLRLMSGKSTAVIVTVYTNIVINLSNSQANEISNTMMEHLKTEATGSVIDFPSSSKLANAEAAAEAAASNGVVYLSHIKDGIRKLFSKCETI